MNNKKINLYDLEAANSGSDVARWKIIKVYEEDIRKIAKGNTDLEHYIIVELFELFNVLNKRYISTAFYMSSQWLYI